MKYSIKTRWRNPEVGEWYRYEENSDVFLRVEDRIATAIGTRDFDKNLYPHQYIGVNINTGALHLFNKENKTEILKMRWVCNIVTDNRVPNVGELFIYNEEWYKAYIRIKEKQVINDGYFHVVELNGGLSFFPEQDPLPFKVITNSVEFIPLPIN